MAFQIVDTRKTSKLTWTWQRDAIDAIHEYSTFRFAADGRCFSMALNGESIGHLMNAYGSSNFEDHPEVWRELHSIAGAIVIYDEHEFTSENNEILFYRDRQQLIDAWRELHSISGVEIGEYAQERLEEYDDSDDED